MQNLGPKSDKKKGHLQGYVYMREYIKEIESYTTFKKEFKSFLLLHSFHSAEEFVAL
jgi:hypothetical protein